MSVYLPNSTGQFRTQIDGDPADICFML